MVIFQYNLYIFVILFEPFYIQNCYNELCYKEVEVYYFQSCRAKQVLLQTMWIQMRWLVTADFIRICMVCYYVFKFWQRPLFRRVDLSQCKYVCFRNSSLVMIVRPRSVVDLLNFISSHGALLQVSLYNGLLSVVSQFICCPSIHH